MPTPQPMVANRICEHRGAQEDAPPASVAGERRRGGNKSYPQTPLLHQGQLMGGHKCLAHVGNSRPDCEESYPSKSAESVRARSSLHRLAYRPRNVSANTLSVSTPFPLDCRFFYFEGLVVGRGPQNPDLTVFRRAGGRRLPMPALLLLHGGCLKTTTAEEQFRPGQPPVISRLFGFLKNEGRRNKAQKRRVRRPDDVMAAVALSVLTQGNPL